jgi:two-component system response regulator
METKIDILFAEDNIADANLTLRALKKGGLKNNIFHVKDGAEALDFLYDRGDFAGKGGGEKLKLVLLDLKMPKVSGMEVLQQIKSDEQLKTIPVVILTSSKEDPDVRRSYELGANSYIVKPVESDNFFQAIKDLGFYWLITNQAL